MSKIVDTLYDLLLGFDTDGVYPGFGGVGAPEKSQDGTWTITLYDESTLAVPVAEITVKEMP